MAEVPKVSIIIATYNRPQFLKETLMNLRFQLDPQLVEVIVIDDGSPEGVFKEVLEVARGLDFVQLIRKPYNTGCADTRNEGLRQAKGQWILILDDDDLLMPHVLKEYFKATKSYPQADVFYGDLSCFSSDPERTVAVAIYFDFYQSPEGLLNLLLFRDWVPHPGTMIRRKVLEQVGGYNKTMRRAVDYELWSRLADTARFKHLECFTIKYRMNNQGLTAKAMRSGDLSAEKEVSKGILRRHSLERIFLWLDWSSPLAHSRATEVLGALFLLLGGPEEAIGYLEKDISGRDMWRKRIMLMGSLLFVGRWKDAIRTLNLIPEEQWHPKERAFYALLKNPNLEVFDLIKKEILTLAQQVQVESMIKAVKHFGYHLALLKRAKRYRNEGLLEEALACLKKALVFDPNNRECHRELALLLLEVGDVEKARQHMKKALGGNGCA